MRDRAPHCPVELKKEHHRTIVEEIIVDLDEQEKTLRFVIHWKGGTHTCFEMPKSLSKGDFGEDRQSLSRG